jgi:hypothetical protein
MNFFNNLGRDFQHLGGSINNAFHPQNGQKPRTPPHFIHGGYIAMKPVTNPQPTPRPTPTPTPTPTQTQIKPPNIFHGGYVAKPTLLPPVNTHIANAEHYNAPVQVDRISGNNQVAKSPIKDSTGLFPPAQSYVVPIVVGAVIISVLLK